MSISLRVELAETYEAAFWKAINLRNRYISTYDGLARSTIQQILEVVKFRDELAPGATRKEIAEKWQSQLVDTGSQVGDKVDFSFVDTAIKVHDRLLCYPSVFAAIMQMENIYGKASCLNFIRVLELVCMKGREPEQHWMVESIFDYVTVLKEYTNKDMSTRALGGASGGGNRGLLDLFCAKRKMALWLLDHLHTKQCPVEWMDVLRDLLVHRVFRQRVGGGRGLQPDISWMGTEHEIVRMVIDILKAGLFGSVGTIGKFPFWFGLLIFVPKMVKRNLISAQSHLSESDLQLQPRPLLEELAQGFLCSCGSFWEGALC